MKTIRTNINAELTVKKSKFIANIIQINSEKEAKTVIESINKKYHDARHNCYAYIIEEKCNHIERFSDNGEPSGTAGTPILDILRNKELVNVVVIVTRYFGGILLGTRRISESILRCNFEGT